jgi:diacylglycerol kinase family enzyme
MTRVAILLNERSGSVDSRGRTLDEAVRAVGLDATILRLSGAAMTGAAERAVADGCTLVAAGGDGTVSTIASVAVRTHATFGVIPLGTLNHFARDVGIPLDPAEAAAVIAAGHTRDLDVGAMNDDTFVNNLSIGLYPRLVWERQREQYRGRGKWTAFAIGLVRTWRRYPTVTVSLDVDGVSLRRHTPFVFIGNGEYQAEGIGLGSRASLADGSLAIYLAPGVGRFELLQLPLRAIAGRLSTTVKFETFHAFDVEIRTHSSTFAVALDGELKTGVRSPLGCRLLPRALRTIVPAGK